MSNRDIRTRLVALFEAAVASAHPRFCLPAHCPDPPQGGRLILLAAGKAAGSMTEIAATHYGRLGVAGIEGLAVTRHGYGVVGTPGLVEVIEAGHPTPDEAGLRATARTLALAATATRDDLVLVLLSGGGSANWIAPAGDLSLDEKRAITRQLLRSGADIGEINTVRKHLSRIKGGRLAAACGAARILTLAMSDVPRDDPSVIASGPTVADPTTLEDARAIVARRGITLPASALALLNDPANETPKPGSAAFDRAEYRVICRPADMIAAVSRQVEAMGYEPIVLGADVEGEAQAVARDHSALARQTKAEGRHVAIISGGELTVTIPKGSTAGRGGPNQEYALALALALEGEPGILALAGDTDGIDGGEGASDDPAGALVDPTTLRRGRAAGLDAERSLHAHDSTRFFETLGDLVKTGPTRTNVNDCRIILVD